jgi:cellulose synthase/poly-beta-1,6-N-acetylglucosamine synthase-like glycosyltransferase
METRKLTVAIPYYNNSKIVMETLHPLIFDDRIDEIIICDDVSPDEDFHQLLTNIKGLPKIKVYRNVKNMYVQQNKRNAISFAKNDWVVIMDNDNVADRNFFNRLFGILSWDPKVIYHPAFASPNFDYRKFNGEVIIKQNVKDFTAHNIFVTLCNTNNYMLNKAEYLRVYHYDSSIRGADGIYNFYNWLLAGNSVYIVPDLTYFHRISETSAFLSETDSNMKLIYYWLNKLKELQ